MTRLASVARWTLFALVLSGWSGLFGNGHSTAHPLCQEPENTSSAAGESNSQPSAPNVLFIMTDDQGYWDTGATGNPHIDTPHIDSIAVNGLQMDRYYVAPVCAPTRAGVMTGRYYPRTGVYNTRFGGDSLATDEIILPELLAQAGYRNGLFGKWHLGKYSGYQPQQRGFDEFFGHYHGHIERYEFPDQVFHNGRPAEARGYVTDIFTTAAIDFIEHATDQHSGPFFCAVMYNAPHSPFLLDTSHFQQAEGDKLLVKYLERGLPIREARIYAMIERIDQNVGRLLSTIEKLGIERETIIVFTSDNGGVSKFWQGGMRGNKASVFEGGVRAPCFVRWTGHLQPGRVLRSMTSHLDWLPTFAELAGVELPADRPIDGKSLCAVWQSDSDQPIHDYVYHIWDRYQPDPDRRWAISDQRWKLLCQVGSEQTPERRHWKLFDLASDPGETTDVKSGHPQHVARLRQEFLRWFAEVTAERSFVPIAIPVAGQEVELEPSWAKWDGEHIRYEFDGYDWDTIEGWREAGESASWRLDVQQPGRYQVQLTYGCRPLDAGGVLAIHAGDQSLAYRVEPTTAADQYESRVIGHVELAEGESVLTALVQESVGGELMRLNRIVLKPLF